MSVTETTPLARGETLKLEQREMTKGFLGLSLKNGLLNIITLTLYRFWGKTEVRRRVWRATYLNDEPFEYTGRGGELFKGFLFALLIVGLPFLLVVFAAQMMGPMLGALIILPLYIFMFFLVGFGMFTAFRYMASRTTWRGIRFRLEGSAVDYGLRFIACAVISGLTLGWFWPTARRKLAKRIWMNLRFGGDLPFRFDEAACRKEKVYGAFTLAWVGSFVAYVLIAGVAVVMGLATKDAAPSEEASLGMIAIIYLLMLILMPFLLLLYAPYQAAILRSVAAGIVLGDARFKLNVRWLELFWLTLTNILLIVVTLGFLTPYVEARTARFLVDRISSEGQADLVSVRQAERGPRTGEGLADAFGLAPI